jgi:hypothetical protein
LWTVAGLAVWSPPMLCAALARRYRADLFGLAGWIVTFVGLVVSPAEAFWPGATGVVWCKCDGLLILAGALAAFLYLGFPQESILGNDDSGVYANHGISISRLGRVDIPFPWRGEGNRELAHMFKEHDALPGDFFRAHLFPGFIKFGPSLSVQFAHLFPLWLSAAYSSFGHRGMFRLNGILALLSIGVFYGLCTCLVPQPFALLGAVLLALNPGTVWAARVTLSETMTQLFVWAGLLLFLLAFRAGFAHLALLAGAFFGLSAFVRCDSLLLAPLLFVTQLLTQVASQPGQATPSVWLLLYGVMLPLMLLSVLYLALFSTPYFSRNVLYYLRIIGLASLLLSGPLLLVPSHAWRQAQPWLTSRAALLTIDFVTLSLVAYGYWLRPRLRRFILDYPGHPLHGTRYYAENTVVDFSRYISPFILCAALLGWLVTVRDVTLSPLQAHMVVLLTVGGGFSALYLYDPFDDPGHFRLIRRYVPVVLPSFVLFAVVGLWWALDRWPGLAPRGAVLLIAGLVGHYLLRGPALRFFIFFADKRGVFAQLRSLAQRLPGDRVILALGPPEVLTPLAVAFGCKVVPWNGASAAGQKLLANWTSSQADRSEPVYLLWVQDISDSPGVVRALFGQTLAYSFLGTGVVPFGCYVEKKRLTFALYQLNDRTVTAPAQRGNITDQFDPNLACSTLQPVASRWTKVF